MPRVIVMTDPQDDAAVLLDERVHSVHLNDEHSAAQLIQRLGWAVGDAEDAERRRAQRKARTHTKNARARSRAARQRQPQPS